MPDEETVNTVTATTLSAVDTPVSPLPTESSKEIKDKITEPAPQAKKEPKNVTTNKSPQQKLDTRSSDEIRKKLDEQRKSGTGIEALSKDGDAKKDGSPEQAKQTEEVDRSKWFDPERGFKTADDMKKSYMELQDTFRKKSEEIKIEKGKLELEQAQIKQEAEKMKELQERRRLTPEEKEREASIKAWETENKEALDLIESKISERLAQKNLEQKNLEVNSSIENQIIKERNDWLQNFNKDEGRKKLWPVMEQVFREKGDTAETVVRDFAKNPLPYIEAMALHKNFASIAEQIKTEAVEQYKATVKEAAEVERKTKFALPGGPKAGTGDVDVTKLSSSELASLLPRNENG